MTLNPLRRKGRDERGSVTIEAAISVLGLVAIASLGIAATRIAHADNVITGAAHDAARTASLARDPHNARNNARAAAQAALGRQQLTCQRLNVDVDTAGFAVAVGQPATVTVTVTCQVQLADVTPVPGLPGAIARTARFTSPLDQYRER